MLGTLEHQRGVGRQGADDRHDINAGGVKELMTCTALFAECFAFVMPPKQGCSQFSPDVGLLPVI